MPRLLVFLLLGCGRLNFDAGGDAAIGSGGTTCVPRNTFMCGTTTFTHCEGEPTHAGAVATCSARGERLALIDDAAENDCLREYMDTGGGPDRMWIGLVQAPTATTPTAGWVWSNGSTYFNWNPDVPEPDDNGGVENGEENCVVLNDARITMTSYGWFDVRCTAPHPAICEKP
jgi:hypothetical protein